MKTYSQFVSHYVENRKYMAPRDAEAIRQAANRRLAERYAAGRGDVPLDFADLADRIERAIAA